jgi:alcohol dehydrogenase, propanol-preferring
VKMNVYRLLQWHQPPQLVHVSVPDLGPGQVLIKMGGAGACHSDLHLLEWTPENARYKPGFTLGHENAGWVAKLGQGVQGREKGGRPNIADTPKS